jgi:hypothetical protein
MANAVPPTRRSTPNLAASGIGGRSPLICASDLREICDFTRAILCKSSSGPHADRRFDSARQCRLSLRFRRMGVEFLYTQRNHLNYNGFPHTNGDIATWDRRLCGNRRQGAMDGVRPRWLSCWQAIFRHTARIQSHWRRFGARLGPARTTKRDADHVGAVIAMASDHSPSKVRISMGPSSKKPAAAQPALRTVSRSPLGTVPAETKECIWMSAGVLSYRLCDRAFDCEHCLLDKALHGGHSGASAAWTPGEWGPKRVPAVPARSPLQLRAHLGAKARCGLRARRGRRAGGVAAVRGHRD